ncbi:MAG: hypothetical protein LBQ79_01175 [Deltaproteobacteria bacterium]|nr:hypothetical protein [Deltaproteobacteria bacterium]
MIIATLDNDASKGDGWALLKVPLIGQDGVELRPLPGPGERYCLISVKDLDRERFLQGPSSEVHWDSQEIFYQVPLMPGDGTALELRVPPDITDYMESNFFCISIKCEAGLLPQVVAQADHISRRSGPLAAEENYAIQGPGKNVVAWIHREGEAPAQGPSWLASAQPDDLAPVPQAPSLEPQEDGGGQGDYGSFGVSYGTDGGQGVGARPEQGAAGAFRDQPAAGFQDPVAGSWQEQGAGGWQEQGEGSFLDRGAGGWQEQGGGGSGLPVNDLPAPDDQSPFFAPSGEEEAARTAFEPLEYALQVPEPELPPGGELPDYDRPAFGMPSPYGDVPPPPEEGQPVGFQDPPQGFGPQGVAFTDGGQPSPGAPEPYAGQGGMLAQEPPGLPAAPQERKGLGPLPIILAVLLLLILGGGALYYFKFRDTGVPDVARGGDVPGTEAGHPGGEGGAPVPEAAPPGDDGDPEGEEPDGEEPDQEEPDEGDGGGGSAEPGGIAPPAGGREAAGPGPSTNPAETARTFLEQGRGPSDLVPQVAGMEGSDDPEVVRALFDTVSEISKYEPEYKLRLGAFYDPLDRRPTSVQKDPWVAWEEYTEAAAQGASGARERLAALSEWANSPDAENFPDAASRIRSYSR